MTFRLEQFSQLFEAHSDTRTQYIATCMTIQRVYRVVEMIDHKTAAPIMSEFPYTWCGCINLM